MGGLARIGPDWLRSPHSGLTTVPVWPPVPPSRPSPSPSTPEPVGSGPSSWTSGPEWSTWPTASSPSTTRSRAGSSTTRPRSGTWSGPRSTPWPDDWPTSGGRSGPSASPTSVRPSWPGTGTPAIRCTGPSSGRTAGPLPCAGPWSRPVISRWSGSAPGSSSTPTSRPPRCSGSSVRVDCRGTDGRPAAISPSARSTHGCCGTSPAERTAGCWPPTPPTPRAPCSSTSSSGGGRRSSATCSAFPRTRSPRSGRPAGGWAGYRLRPWEATPRSGGRPSAGWPATSTPRSSARPASTGA